MCDDLLDVLHTAVTQARSPKSIKAFARQVNYTESMIYKLIEGRRGKQDLLDIIIAWTNYSGDIETIQHIAAQCNGTFIPLPKVSPKLGRELLEQLSELQEESSDVIGEVAKSMKDGSISKEDAKRIIKELDEEAIKAGTVKRLLQEVVNG